jgi:hypothetical protein
VERLLDFIPIFDWHISRAPGHCSRVQTTPSAYLSSPGSTLKKAFLIFCETSLSLVSRPLSSNKIIIRCYLLLLKSFTVGCTCKMFHVLIWVGLGLGLLTHTPLRLMEDYTNFLCTVAMLYRYCLLRICNCQWCYHGNIRTSDRGIHEIDHGQESPGRSFQMHKGGWAREGLGGKVDGIGDVNDDDERFRDCFMFNSASFSLSLFQKVEDGSLLVITKAMTVLSTSTPHLTSFPLTHRDSLPPPRLDHPSHPQPLPHPPPSPPIGMNVKQVRLTFNGGMASPDRYCTTQQNPTVCTMSISIPGTCGIGGSPRFVPKS